MTKQSFKQPKKLSSIAKEHRSLERLLKLQNNIFHFWIKLMKIKKCLQDDTELVELARDELPSLEIKKSTLEDELALLLPKDPNDDKNLILEIRAGTGGAKLLSCI